MSHHNVNLRLVKPGAGLPADLLNHNFDVSGPNEVWVADMTEFPTGEGKLHLAAIRFTSLSRPGTQTYAYRSDQPATRTRTLRWKPFGQG